MPKTSALNKLKTGITLPRPVTISITNQLRFGPILLVIMSLLLTAGALIYLSFQTQLQQLESLQQERSRAAAGEIDAYLNDLQRKLSYLARVRGLTEFSPEDQQSLLEGLIQHNSAYEAAAILNQEGQVVSSVSAYGDPISDNLADSPLFLQAFKQKENVVGLVEIDPSLGLPVVSLMVPIRDQQNEVAGVLLARANLEFLWFVVSQTNVGQSGYAYVIDDRDFLIAQKGSSSETFQVQDISDQPFVQDLISGAVETLISYQGLNGTEVLGAIAPIRSVNWNVVVELPTAEAFAPIRTMLLVMGGALGLITAIVVGAGIFFSRGIILPLQHLTEASQRFGDGDMASRADIASRNEIGELATTFNEMMTRIDYLVYGLEDRNRRLEIIAILSERLTAILNLEELLVQAVKQIKDEFSYDHVHIYLLDDEREKLVVAEGADETEPAAKGHNILVDDPTSLAAHAARTGEIQTRQAEDRLSNSLLPGPSSEMAVPIILEGQVVGVLDVQADGIAGLEEEDANVLRSLANQIAVGIRNARQFKEVETALAEAHAAQERYQKQSWDKAKIAARKGQYTYARPDAPAPDEAALTAVKQQDPDQSRPAVLTVNQADQGTSLRSIIAPVTLRNTPIGAVEIHPARVEQVWSEGDLAIVEAVTEALSLAAENMRLFDETRERAGREATIREITEKLQAAPNIDLLLETAARELSSRLDVQGARLKLGIEQGTNETPGNGHEV